MIGILELWTLRDNFGIEFMDQKSNRSVEMMSIFLFNKLIIIIFFSLPWKTVKTTFWKSLAQKSHKPGKGYRKEINPTNQHVLKSCYIKIESRQKFNYVLTCNFWKITYNSYYLQAN